MPGFPWLTKTKLSADEVKSHMRGLARLGDPYTQSDFDGVGAAIDGKTEMDALIAYLQGLGKFGPKETQP